MAENSGSTIVKATRYIHDVCDEVVAVCKTLQERFSKSLPEQYAVSELNTWPTQSPGNKFFEAYGCWIDVSLKRPRKAYFGCAAYLFDLGGLNTFATMKNEALVLVGWTGKMSDDVYDVEHLQGVMSTHTALGDRLFCWIEDDGKPRHDPENQSWCYAVPLLNIKTEDDAERLLIKPLIKLVAAPQLTKTLVRQAFDDASDVMTEIEISKKTRD
jgi:hypothetical protein